MEITQIQHLSLCKSEKIHSGTLILHVLLAPHAVMRGNSAIFNLFVDRHWLEFFKCLIFYNMYYELSTPLVGFGCLSK